LNRNSLETLEFGKIAEELKRYAVTEKAKDLFDNLEPSADIDLIRARMNETTEARAMLDRNPSVPLSAMENINKVVVKLGKGVVLTVDEFESCKSLLESVRKLRKYMDSMQYVAPQLASYALSMYELGDLWDEIDRCIVNRQVADRATPELGKLRKKITILQDRIKQKLNGILASQAYAPMLQEPVVSIRNGRYVVPVKREYRKSFEGNILDISSTGATVFVEPAGVGKIQEELNILRLEEENEVYRVSLYLTGMVEGYAREFKINIEAMEHYDYVFAKAKYSVALDGRPVMLNCGRRTVIEDGRHPLLGRNAVPLDFKIGEAYRALVITGPNTGGKTVALKTVGLMTLMVQSGLHVPVGEGSEFAVFADVLVDIGDGQSIEQSLSTFSSHVRNISTIIKCADKNTLVIMDELGAGTEPGEGMGFAIAVLEEIFDRDATIVASTHFSEIKEFAKSMKGFENGCMEFDIESLKPVYKLSIGRSGDSNALLIALKLGIERRIIERAHEIAHGEKREYVINSLPEPTSIVDTDALETHERTKKIIENRTKEKERLERSSKSRQKGFKIGDCVFISTMKRTGIVCVPENDRGEVVVMVMQKKLKISSKRLSLHIDGKELYPENYDLDIVFETKENRKKRKTMSKRHVEGLEVKDDV